ncbi:alpha/beta hydrolase [Enterococcus faecalis]|uniref:alpha/beta hydrolase n=1 Tax=Enterococcus faecalis TaxID=1351 RepID=UPI000459A3BF|nr:alpha/beta hydrolase [Enterococcus faecalis]KAJ61001.1 Esterase/lipase [Enterococcus faecalis KS19]
MKKVKIICICILTCIILIFSVCIMALSFTPKPLFKFANFIPIQSNLTKPYNYTKIYKNTDVKRNITYSENYSNSTLDIYYPKKLSRKIPVVLFIHGGGFFKGDKEMAKYFGPTISNNQYAFISINYNLVPKVTLFDQLRQINEAIEFIQEKSDEYSLDSSSINLSGSSAGGFLALQLLSAYHDTNYAKELQINPIKNIRFNSLLLYSAVYNLAEFQTMDGNIVTNYLLTKIGWGITGERHWRKDNNLGESLNLNNYISNDFPPIFITDGNTKTFTGQAVNYTERLYQKQIPVQTLFFDSEEKVGHGYQLQMDTPASKQAINKSLEFLHEWNKK